MTDPIPNLVEFALEHGVTFADLKRANLWLRESKLNNNSHRTYYIDIPDLDPCATTPPVPKSTAPLGCVEILDEERFQLKIEN